MSDLEDTHRLRRALRMFTQSDQLVTQAGRQIWEPGSGSPRSAVLQEISETVLRRVITFKAAENTLSLDVAERRVLKVVEASGATDLCGQALETNDVAAFNSLLNDFEANTLEQKIFAMVHLPQTSDFGEELGLSTFEIEDFVNKSRAAANADLFAKSANESKSFAKSIVSLSEGVITSKWGDSDLAQKLINLLEKRSQIQMPDQQSIQCAIWVNTMPDGLAILRATLKPLEVAVVFSETEINTCLACWHKQR